MSYFKIISIFSVVMKSNKPHIESEADSDKLNESYNSEKTIMIMWRRVSISGNQSCDSIPQHDTGS